MQKKFIPFKFKAALALCLFVSLNCLTAQNTENYKYIIFPTDTCYSTNSKILEVNNHYYILSYLKYSNFTQQKSLVSVFDENLNMIKQIQLSEGAVDYGDTVSGDTVYGCAASFFYEKDTFYVFFVVVSTEDWLSPIPTAKIYFAKYDEDFNLASVFTYIIDDTLFIRRDTLTYMGDTLIFADTGGWRYDGVLMTRNNEFIIYFHEKPTGDALFMRLDNQGTLLEEVFVPSAGWLGMMVETDSHYIMNYWHSPHLIKFSKDSLSKYEWVRDIPKGGYYYFDGTAIAVGNQLIRSYVTDVLRGECPDEWGYPTHDDEIGITFLNDDFSIREQFVFGTPCINDRQGFMHYKKPDSIYSAYSTGNFLQNGSTIGIACFSSEGTRHFNYTLDIDASDITIFDCKVLSNGGVLVAGDDVTYYQISPYEYSYTTKGFLLYYHPTKKINTIVETQCIASLPQIFPNPARSQFTVTNTENANLYLYNIVGQEVLQTFSKEDNTVININFLPQGVYVLKVVKEGNVSVHKIIVKE